MDNKEIENDTAKFFEEKLCKYGATPKGLDYNISKQHILRIEILLSMIDLSRENEDVSIADFGCGFGSLIDLLNKDYFGKYRYFGYDISPQMIEMARNLWKKQKNVAFQVGGIESIQSADYIICSGVFNKKMGYSKERWSDYLNFNISRLFELTKNSLIFNILTTKSDPDKRRDDLYYADPGQLLNFCLNFTDNISLRHDYGLYDFSICMTKN